MAVKSKYFRVYDKESPENLGSLGIIVLSEKAAKNMLSEIAARTNNKELRYLEESKLKPPIIIEISFKPFSVIVRSYDTGLEILKWKYEENFELGGVDEEYFWRLLVLSAKVRIINGRTCGTFEIAKF
jgi:hypothetical protein